MDALVGEGALIGNGTSAGGRLAGDMMTGNNCVVSSNGRM